MLEEIWGVVSVLLMSVVVFVGGAIIEVILVDLEGRHRAANSMPYLDTTNLRDRHAYFPKKVNAAQRRHVTRLQYKAQTARPNPKPPLRYVKTIKLTPR